MRFKVYAADATTGEERRFTVQAANEARAEAAVRKRGYLVSRVDPIAEAAPAPAPVEPPAYEEAPPASSYDGPAPAAESDDPAAALAAMGAMDAEPQDPTAAQYEAEAPAAASYAEQPGSAYATDPADAQPAYPAPPAAAVTPPAPLAYRTPGAAASVGGLETTTYPEIQAGQSWLSFYAKVLTVVAWVVILLGALAGVALALAARGDVQGIVTGAMVFATAVIQSIFVFMAAALLRMLGGVGMAVRESALNTRRLVAQRGQ